MICLPIRNVCSREYTACPVGMVRDLHAVFATKNDKKSITTCTAVLSVNSEAGELNYPTQKRSQLSHTKTISTIPQTNDLDIELPVRDENTQIHVIMYMLHRSVQKPATVVFDSHKCAPMCTRDWAWYRAGLILVCSHVVFGMWLWWDHYDQDMHGNVAGG